MEKTIIYSNERVEIYIENNTKILYINVIDGEYNKDLFHEAVEYYKNFWILINNTDDKYFQVFIFNNVKLYPFEFYDTMFKTLKSLENIFKKNLYSSCVVNNSNAIDILKPLINMYKAVKPFSFVKTLEEGIIFLNNNRN